MSGTCNKLLLPPNLRALIKKAVYEDDNKVEEVKCDKELVHKVMSNYIIVKRIISNLSWQDMLLCKLVCTTWCSAVRALQKESLEPQDFSFHYFRKQSYRYKKSGKIHMEPLVVFTFVNIEGFSAFCKCDDIIPPPCSSDCKTFHSLVDVAYTDICAPKNCMLTVRASAVSYLPLTRSPTYDQTIKRVYDSNPKPFVGGVYIPNLPEVEFQVINIVSKDNLQEEFYDIIDKLVKTRIIKGVIVYETEKYLLYSSEDIVFLNYITTVQPDIPYALGGCIVEDTMTDENNFPQMLFHINKGTNYVTENFITIGVFTVPKGPTSEDNNFDMFSLVVESSDWAKNKIQKTISEFSRNVPRFEHSLALKLSCVGRVQKHAFEQDTFRAEFPNTRIVGCYGNGELGINHPPKPTDDSPVKRHKLDPGPQYGIMFSYSTVFVYMGWGKRIS